MAHSFFALNPDVPYPKNVEPIRTVLIPRILSRMDTGRMCAQFLNDLADPRLNAPTFLARVIEQNPAYVRLLSASELLQKRKSKWAEAEPEGDKAHAVGDTLLSDRLLLMMGRSATRDAVISLRMMRALGLPLPRKAGESLVFEPRERIKTALAVEDFSMEHQLAHSETNYVGGLFYDWILAILAQEKLLPKTAESSVGEAKKLGYKMGQIAYRLASALKSFKYERHVFATAFCAPVGGILMPVLFPQAKGQGGWIDHLERLAALKFADPQVVGPLLEAKHLKILSSEVAMLALASFPPLRKMALAVRYRAEHTQLTTADPARSQLALIVGSAERLALMGSVSPIQERALKKLGISGSHIQTSFKSAAEVKE